MKEGAELIAVERRRQKEVEGFTPEHDAKHSSNDLAQAAACYLEVAPEPLVRLRWPWAPVQFKRTSFPYPTVRDLVKGGALAAAAIDLRQAREAPGGQQDGSWTCRCGAGSGRPTCPHCRSPRPVQARDAESQEVR